MPQKDWNDRLRASRRGDGSGLLLPTLGFALMLAGGFLGWKMMQPQPVGIDVTPAQTRLEPRSGEKPPPTERPPRGGATDPWPGVSSRVT